MAKKLAFSDNPIRMTSICKRSCHPNEKPIMRDLTPSKTNVAYSAYITTAWLTKSVVTHFSLNLVLSKKPTSGCIEKWMG